MDAVRFGASIQHDDYNQLPDEEKKRISAAIAELQPRLEKILNQIPQWMKERECDQLI